MSTTTRVTLAQYHEMIRQGLFVPREEHHVELIEGEITPMSPIGPPHSWFLNELNEWSSEIGARAFTRVRIQDPVEMPEMESEPEPDFVWARRLDYREQHPRPADVLLLIEVSQSSLAFDRGRKARLYARAGIADYWIVNGKESCVEVRRDQEGDSYRSLTVLRAGEEVRPLAFPAVVLPVARLFPD